MLRQEVNIFKNTPDYAQEKRRSHPEKDFWVNLWHRLVNMFIFLGKTSAGMRAVRGVTGKTGTEEGRVI